MGTEEQKVIEERVWKIRRQMEEAARQAGRKPEEILLLAASKTQSAQRVAFSAGLDIDLFGENRAQELVEKMDAGAYRGKPVHMIGHLQKNKAKYAVGRAALIHSADSLELAGNLPPGPEAESGARRADRSESGGGTEQIRRRSSGAGSSAGAGLPAGRLAGSRTDGNSARFPAARAEQTLFFRLASTFR